MSGILIISRNPNWRSKWHGEYKTVGMEAFFEMITELAKMEWPELTEREVRVRVRVRG